MFWFWKKKDNFNKIELERFIFHKTESMYHFRDSFYTIEPRKKKFGINTVVKNVPVTIVGDKLIAKVRYIGIPDSTVISYTYRLKSKYVRFVNPDVKLIYEIRDSLKALNQSFLQVA